MPAESPFKFLDAYDKADKEIFFGSNTTAVIKSAYCSVLAVPEATPIKKPKTIVLAADYENLTTMDELIPLKELALRWSSNILIVKCLLIRFK